MTSGPPPPPNGGDPERPPRGPLRLLRDPLFGRFFVGRVIASVGVWIYNVVGALLAYELTGSAFVVGLMSVALFLPQLLLAPWAGVAADRGDRRRQAIMGRYVVVSGAGGMAGWLALTDLSRTTDVIVLVGSAVVVGLGFVVGGPALHALIPGLVRPNEIPGAVTLDVVPATVARAAGPIAGVAIALALGPEVAFAVAALCSVGFALVLHSMRPARRGARTVRTARTGVWGGFSYLRLDPAAARLLVGITAIGIGADPAITLAPSIAVGNGQEIGFVGAIASAFGIGAGVAFLLIPLARRLVGLSGYGTVGLVLMGIGAAALLVADTSAVTLGAFALAGTGMTFGVTSLSSQLQQRAPDELRGRIMALWSMAFLGSRPVAAAMNGALADHLSVSSALVVVAVLMAVAGWICRPGRLG